MESKTLNKRIAKRIVRDYLPLTVCYGYGVKLSRKAKVVFDLVDTWTCKDPDREKFEILSFGCQINFKKVRACRNL